MATLRRAQRGDGDAFEELVGPHRDELLAHCYRMLGSLDDAEDVIQEALVAAWRGLDGFDGRSWRAWLYRIATNRCLNHLRDGARRPALPMYSSAPLGEGLVDSDEPWWIEPYPDVLLGETALGPEARYDARESIGLSFVTALQRLPARQRAVLVLRDVLGFSAAESAEMLGTTATSVNSALVRARAGLHRDRTPEQIRLPRSRHEAEVVERFIDAFQSGDVRQVVALLTDDARLAMPPEPFACHGPHAIARFLLQRGVLGADLKLVPTRANNQPAFGYYLRDPAAPVLRARGLLVLGISDQQVSTITRFSDKGLLARFGLPRTLPPDSPPGG
jgi:RNA polymerase sigma-70 factor (ECF subfamily)